MLEDIKEIRSLVLIKNKSLTKQVVENSAYSFATSLIARIGGLLFTILVARVLLPEMFGLYSLALSIILTAATFLDLGINTALSRYLAESLSKGRKGEAEGRSRVRFLFNLKISLSLIIALIIFFIAPILSNFLFHKPELTLPLQIGSLYIFIIGIQGFFATVFYPLKKLKFNFLSEVLFQIFRLGLFFVLINLYKTVAIIFWVLILSISASLLFYFMAILIKQRKLFFGALVKVERKKITVFLSWAIVLSCSAIFFGHIDTFMLGIFVENEFIGYYNAFFAIVGAVIGIISFGGIFLPVFTEIQKERLKRGFRKITKYSAILAIPASTGLAFIIIPAIRIIYGLEYVPQENYFQILIASALISLLVVEEVFTSIYSSLFAAKERLKIPAIALAILTIANIALNYLFIKIALSFGMAWTLVAVAFATFLTRYTNLFVLASLAKKNFSLLPDKQDILKPIAASVIMLGFLFLFNYLFKPGLWLTIMMVCLAVGVYFAVLIIIPTRRK